MTGQPGPDIFYHDVFPTSAGWMAVLATDKGLTALTLPQATEEKACRALGEKLKEAARAPGRFAGLAGRLQRYFNGHKGDFPDRLDLSGATSFQREVWEAARRIPRGQTRSYRWVAAQAGRPGAARAAGQALHKNPLPVIIPCHRVIAADGGLGGYRGGTEMKMRLLRIEKTHP